MGFFDFLKPAVSAPAQAGGAKKRGRKAKPKKPVKKAGPKPRKSGKAKK